MASMDSLPADQRAVLQLVLQRGRSYEDIARMLSIDRTAVRQRALTALDALGPRTGLPDERRAVITDYLLGQLAEADRLHARDRLAESPGERAWARVLASELGPLAIGSLPEIPVEASAGADRTAVHDGWEESAAADEPGRAAESPVGPAPVPASASSTSPPRAAEPGEGAPPGGEPPRPRRAGPGPSSRRGGIVLIAAAILVVVVVALILLLNTGGSSNKHSSSTPQSTSTPAASSSTSTTSTAAKVVAQINLTPPTAGSKAAGIAEVLKEGVNHGIAIVAQNVPPNTSKPPNAYAVWLYNSPNDAHILGFVNPGVSKTGRLSTAGGLPTNASHFKQLVVTVEKTANPKTPGPIILQGTLTGL